MKSEQPDIRLTREQPISQPTTPPAWIGICPNCPNPSNKLPHGLCVPRKLPADPPNRPVVAFKLTGVWVCGLNLVARLLKRSSLFGLRTGGTLGVPLVLPNRATQENFSFGLEFASP